MNQTKEWCIKIINSGNDSVVKSSTWKSMLCTCGLILPKVIYDCHWVKIVKSKQFVYKKFFQENLGQEWKHRQYINFLVKILNSLLSDPDNNHMHTVTFRLGHQLMGWHIIRLSEKYITILYEKCLQENIQCSSRSAWWGVNIIMYNRWQLFPFVYTTQNGSSTLYFYSIYH